MPKHDPGEPEGFAIPMQRNRCNAVMSENGMVRAVLQPCHKANLARGIEGKEFAMSRKLGSAITVIGIDIGKNAFHIVAMRKRSPKQCRARR